MRKSKLYYKYLPLKKRRGILKYKIFKSVVKSGIGIVPESMVNSKRKVI